MDKVEFKNKFPGLLSPKADTELNKPIALKDVRFGALKANALSVMENDKDIASGFIGEVLQYLSTEKSQYADRKIKEAHYFFDMFVIRL